MNVRTLRTGERIPDGFHTGYEKMPLQEDWVWLAERDGIAVGVLLAAPCHGMVYLMRVCVKSGACTSIVFSLLRACMRDCQQRGFKGFFTHIDPTGEVDRRMIPLVRRAGGAQLYLPQVMLAGSITRAARF